MDAYENDEAKDRSVAALIATLAMAVGIYVGLRVAMPELPVQVYQALMLLPHEN